MQDAAAAGRHSMNYAIAAPLELTQEFRKHLRRLSARIVKQHNTVVDPLDPFEDQIELDRRRHIVPVARPNIGAEYDDVPACEHVEQPLRRRKARETKKWRDRVVPALTVDGVIVFLEASVDFRFRDGGRHFAEVLMGIRMVGDRMTLRQNSAGQGRMSFAIAAQQEKCGAHALGL